MKIQFKTTSREVATNSSFLHNAGHNPCVSWNVRMLTLIATVLCASCGSGVPVDSESTSAELNSETGNTVSTIDTVSTDSVIGLGHSGLGSPDVQAPTIAAAQSAVALESIASIAVEPVAVEPITVEPVGVSESTQSPMLAAAESDLDAPGSPDSSALQELGSELSEPELEQSVDEVPEVAVLPNAREPEEADLTPEAAIELAALEAELAALPPIDPPQVEEPLPLEEKTDSDEQPDPDDGGNETVSKTVSYDSIEANGLGNATYPTDDYYLAEFLYQNPDVCFWEQDTNNKTITSVEVPTPPEDSVYIPEPTGGNDTSMLETFFKKNAGKSVVGQGTYKISALDISQSVTIYNMSIVPVSGAMQLMRILAPDVRIFNSTIDAKNIGSLAIGLNVEDGAHRFVLVNSGIKNIYHRNKANAAAVFIRGANDFYIGCNRFEDIINDTSDKSLTARANSIWMSGRKVHNLTGGLIFNNYASNHQSNGALKDAEFFTVQGYKSVSEENPIRIFANRGFNAGKRMTKSQEGNTLSLSNYVEWNTKEGPLGPRTLRAAFAAHFGDNIIARNNRIKVAANGDFGMIFAMQASNGRSIQDNIHFDSNDIELKDNRDPNANSGPSLLQATVWEVDRKSTGYEATNSSMSNNIVYGTGSVQFYYKFTNGYNNAGGRFETKNNDISVPSYRSDYSNY